MCTQMLRREIVSTVARYIDSLGVDLDAARRDLLPMCCQLRNDGLERLIVGNTITQRNLATSRQIAKRSSCVNIPCYGSRDRQLTLASNLQYVLRVCIGQL